MLERRFSHRAFGGKIAPQAHQPAGRRQRLVPPDDDFLLGSKRCLPDFPQMVCGDGHAVAMQEPASNKRDSASHGRLLPTFLGDIFATGFIEAMYGVFWKIRSHRKGRIDPASFAMAGNAARRWSSRRWRPHHRGILEIAGERCPRTQIFVQQLHHRLSGFQAKSSRSRINAAGGMSMDATDGFGDTGHGVGVTGRRRPLPRTRHFFQEAQFAVRILPAECWPTPQHIHTVTRGPWNAGHERAP